MNSISIRRSQRDSTVKNTKLLAEKLEEREKKGAPKRKISPKVGSSGKNNKDTKGHSEADVNLSTNSQESDNLELTFNNPVLAMDLEAYNDRLREIIVARRDVKGSIDGLPISLVLSLGPQALESEWKALSDSQKTFGNLISKLEVDLNIENLKKMQHDL